MRPRFATGTPVGGTISVRLLRRPIRRLLLTLQSSEQTRCLTRRSLMKKWESPQTRVGGNGRMSMAREPQKQPCSRPLLRPRDYARQAHATTVPRASGVKTSTAWTPPSRRGRKAHNCSLSGRPAATSPLHRSRPPPGPRPQLQIHLSSEPLIRHRPLLPTEPNGSKPTHANLRRARNGAE